MAPLIEALLIFGKGRVSIMPALVPIQSRLLQQSRAVIRKQAILC